MKRRARYLHSNDHHSNSKIWSIVLRIRTPTTIIILRFRRHRVSDARNLFSLQTMYPPRFNKKLVISFLILISAYFVIRIKTYRHVFSSTVRNAAPVHVWEYVSDFSNMKILIPNIISFRIESESGNHDNWKYRVYYEEYLSQLHSFKNFAWAEYETKKLSESKYVVYSNHQTCFGSSIFCLYTNSVFEVEAIENSTDSAYTETIQYECPAVFRAFCEHEVGLQRNAMKKALDAEFAKRAAQRI